MSNDDNFEDNFDRKELEHALGALRDGWARGHRDVTLLDAVQEVLGQRSGLAYRALGSAWWAIERHRDRAEFTETLFTLARATLEGRLAQKRAQQELDRAREAARAVFE